MKWYGCMRVAWIECSTWSGRSSYFATDERSARFCSNSEMSAPAANASVPAPRNTTQRTSGSASKPAIAGAMPRHIAPLRALRFAGWSKTIQPTLPRFSTLSRFASGSVDRRHRRALVAPRPAAGLDLVEEILQQPVEERRLLEIDAVSAARKDREPGARNAALHEEVRLQADLLLVAQHEERRRVDARHLGGQVVERRTASLHAEHGIRRSECGMLGELADVLGEPARGLG